MSSLGLTVSQSNGFNESIQNINRGLKARDALNLSKHNNLINNVNGTSLALNADVTASREKEGIESAGLISDVRHVQNNIGKNLAKSKKMVGQLQDGVKKASSRIGEGARSGGGSVPQGDVGVAGGPKGKLPDLDFFGQTERTVKNTSTVEADTARALSITNANKTGTLLANADKTAGKAGESSFEDGNLLTSLGKRISKTVDGVGQVIKGGTRESTPANSDGLRGDSTYTSNEYMLNPQQLTDRAKSRLDSLGPESAPGPAPGPITTTTTTSTAPETNLTKMRTADEARVGGGAEATARSVVPSTGTEAVGKVAGGAGELGEISNLGKAMRYGGRALRVANVIGGAIDIGEDIKNKGLTGDNAFDKISNLAGAVSGTAEAIGGVASGLEAVGTGLDLTGGGAVLGVPLQILGAGAGAVGLIGGVVGDIMDNNKDRQAKKNAVNKANSPAPTGSAQSAYSSSTLSGNYAGKTDNNNRIQGTGAF